MSPTISEPSSTATINVANVDQIPQAAGVRAQTPEGFLVWLPAVCILIGLPMLAFATTKYFVLPSIKQCYDQQATALSAGQVETVIVERIQLTQANPALQHSGLRGFALVGEDDNFKSVIQKNREKLTKIGEHYLTGVTVADLEKPGALVAMRARIQVACNQALGSSIIKEVYISEWPASVASR